MELDTGILWTVYGCKGYSKRNQGPVGILKVQFLVLQKGSQETTVQAEKDGLGRMNDRHEDRWGGTGDNDSHLRA